MKLEKPIANVAKNQISPEEETKRKKEQKGIALASTFISKATTNGILMSFGQSIGLQFFSFFLLILFLVASWLIFSSLFFPQQST